MTDIQDLPPSLQDALRRLSEDFDVDANKLRDITAKFQYELQSGLEKPEQNLAMEVTWVRGYPTGEETGKFLVVDLGGTHLRVCWVTLRTNRMAPRLTQKLYRLPDGVGALSVKELWSIVTEHITEFINSNQGNPEAPDVWPMGFTFSSPVVQDRIDQGRLETWTKGNKTPGVEGEDVAAQLRAALKERDLPVQLVASINDTTGTLVASAYEDPATIIGCSFGTGCNAAYVESVGSIAKLSTDLCPESLMVINCECGAFDNSHDVLLRTKYDKVIDECLPNPGERTLEKMVAGRYLGEIFRLILLDLAEAGHIFQGQDTSRLREAYRLGSAVLTFLEEKPVANAKVMMLGQTGLLISDDEHTVLRYVAEMVSRRGARLCACGVAAICRKRGYATGHVAAAGSVPLRPGQFRERWAVALAEILEWPSDRTEDPIVMTHAEDGRGIGTAVVAAMAVGGKD